MPNPLFDGLFGRHAGQTKPFLHLPNGEVVTYQQFLGIAAQYANGFSKLGLRPGDRVAVQVEKSPQALALYAACAQAGLVFLPLNTAYTVDELSYFIENSAAALVICDTTKLAPLGALATRLGAQLRTLNADGTGSLADLAAPLPQSFATVAREADDLAAFLYTSGTTGRSKGAMLTQNNLLSNTQTLVNEWQFTQDDVLLHALPIFHTHGLFVASNVTVGCHSTQSFQHFPTLQCDASLLTGLSGEQRGVGGVGVQDRAGSAGFHDFQVQRRLGAGLPVTQNDVAFPVHLNQVDWGDRSLMDAAWGHQQPNRVGLEDAAEIASGPVAPATAMDLPHGSAQRLGEGRRVGIGHRHVQLRGSSHPGRRGTSGCCGRPTCHVGWVSRRSGRALPCAGRPRPYCRSSRLCRSSPGNH